MKTLSHWPGPRGFVLAGLALGWLGTAALAQETHLTAAEWFVDTDPGYGLGTPIPLPADGVWDEPEEDFVVPGVTVTNLAEGRHNLIIRAKDSNGDWGIPSQTTFYVAPPVTIVAAVWTTNVNDWGDPGLTPAATNQMQAVDGTFDEESEDLVATVNTLALGTNYCMNRTFYLRCQDSLGRWSTRQGLYWDANAQVWGFVPAAGWQTNSVPLVVAPEVAAIGPRTSPEAQRRWMARSPIAKGP